MGPPPLSAQAVAALLSAAAAGETGEWGAVQALEAASDQPRGRTEDSWALAERALPLLSSSNAAVALAAARCVLTQLRHSAEAEAEADASAGGATGFARLPPSVAGAWLDRVSAALARLAASEDADVAWLVLRCLPAILIGAPAAAARLDARRFLPRHGEPRRLTAAKLAALPLVGSTAHCNEVVGALRDFVAACGAASAGRGAAGPGLARLAVQSLAALALRLPEAAHDVLNALLELASSASAEASGADGASAAAAGAVAPALHLIIRRYPGRFEFDALPVFFDALLPLGPHRPLAGASGRPPPVPPALSDAEAAAAAAAMIGANRRVRACRRSRLCSLCQPKEQRLNSPPPPHRCAQTAAAPSPARWSGWRRCWTPRSASARRRRRWSAAEAAAARGAPSWRRSPPRRGCTCRSRRPASAAGFSAARSSGRRQVETRTWPPAPRCTLACCCRRPRRRPSRRR